jgi:hypothetical protein
MTNLSRACLLAAVLVLPACVKTSPTEQSDKGAATTPPPVAAATTVEPAATVAATPTSVPGTGVTLADRLAREAQNRPHIQPNADQVLATMDKLGAGIASKRQGLGSTYKASFCEGGTASDGTLTVSVCEYPDADSARAGLEALKQVFPAKGALHTLHKNTVLTTLRLKDGAVASAHEASLVSAYRAL